MNWHETNQQCISYYSRSSSSLIIVRTCVQSAVVLPLNLCGWCTRAHGTTWKHKTLQGWDPERHEHITTPLEHVGSSDQDGENHTTRVTWYRLWNPEAPSEDSRQQEKEHISKHNKQTRMGVNFIGIWKLWSARAGVSPHVKLEARGRGRKLAESHRMY